MADYKVCPHCREKYSLDAPRCQVCGQEFAASNTPPDGAPVVPTPSPSTPPVPPSPTPRPLPTPTKTGHLYVHQWQTPSSPFVVPRHILPGTPEGYFLDEVTRQYRERLAWQAFFTNTLIVVFLPLAGLLFVAPFIAVLLFIGIVVGILITHYRKQAIRQKVAELGMEPAPWAASLEASVHRRIQIILMICLGVAVSGGIGLFLFGYFGNAPRGGGVLREQRAGLQAIPARAIPPGPPTARATPAEAIPATGRIPARRIPSHGADSTAPGEGRR